MKPKQFVIELIILTSLHILIAIGAHFLLAIFWGNIALDVTLHDTYFPVPFNWIDFTLFPFLLLTTITYLIRATIVRFKKHLINIILVISNLFLTISTLNIYKTVLLLEQEATPTGNGWTVYPPLSALPKQQPELPPLERPYFDHYVLTFILIFMLILAISSILTGKNWKTNAHEQTLS
jgi:heme/copper-type cytochrome/quinol oxidase subunit 1